MAIRPTKQEDTERRVTISSGNKILDGESYTEFTLTDYFVQRIITTFNGYTNINFVNQASRSDLKRND